MEMPKSCINCRFHKSIYCTLTDICTNTAQGCPLVPVPPHGRLIDADALIIALETQDYSCAPDTLEEWTPMDMTKAEIADIRNAPTIIPADPPVMYYPQVPGITPTVIAEEDE